MSDTWDPDDLREQRYPKGLRAALILLQVAAIVLGIVLANVTYDAWSDPGIAEPPAPTTTTVHVPG